jgi:excisionase family DNA binding protein
LPELLRVEEYAKWAGVSRWLAYEQVKRGQLPHVKIGRLVRIKRDGLQTK